MTTKTKAKAKPKTESPKRKSFLRNSFFRQKKVRIILIVVAVILVIRIFLPFILLHFANKRLASMNGYFGHIEDLDLALLRGAYQLEDIYIDKIDENSKNRTDFFKSKVVDIGIEWRSLFKGRIVGNLEFDTPDLRFTKDKATPKQLQKDSTDFKTLLKDFVPIKVNRLEINNGIIRYVDESSSPKVDIKMDDTYLLAQNLSSVVDTALLPSTLKANSKVYGGVLTFNMKLNPLADHATFDMDAELKNTDLTKLNDFFKAYADVDVNKGIFGLYTEVASKNGKYKGYVKPFIKDLDVLGPEDRKEPLFHQIWEGIVGTAGDILENPKEEQIATKIPLEGDLNESHTYTWDAIITLLRNAFFEALVPSIDHEINIGSINYKKEEDQRGFFQKVFGKDEDTSEKKENPKKEDKKEDKKQEKKADEKKNKKNND